MDGLDEYSISIPRLDDSGQLSIDFVVGISIFLIAFTIVATMTAGLLVGLQSRTIDYDAVAYRTGVILTEDPGEIDETVGVSYIAPDRYAWDLIYPDYYDAYHDANMLRMGMAMPRYYYDIPSQIVLFHKIDQLFNITKYNRDFYKDKIIFGDYPYYFNITLTPINGGPSKSVGDPVPQRQQTGYIRRVVMVKHPSNVTLNVHDTSGISNGNMNISINFYNLSSRTPGFMVFPSLERSIINLTNFSTPGTQITSVKVCSPTCEDPQPSSPTIWIKEPDGTVYPSYPIPGGRPVENGTVIEIDPGYLSKRYFPNLGPVDTLEIKLVFSDPSLGGPRSFSYVQEVSFNESFDQPNLTAAVVEAWVW